MSTQTASQTQISDTATAPTGNQTHRVNGVDVEQIHHVIDALPEGYATIVGERGYRLSCVE